MNESDNNIQITTKEADHDIYFFEKKTINGVTFEYIPSWDQQNQAWRLIMVVSE